MVVRPVLERGRRVGARGLQRRGCPLVHSCRQRLVEFIEQLGQLFAEELVRLTQPTALIERCAFQVLRLDADGRGNVVANQIQPGKLLRCEDRTSGLMVDS